MHKISNMNGDHSRLAEIAERSDYWLRHLALPLWAGPGFDETSNTFEERLAWNGQPEKHLPKRLMVQARQIAVYAAAGLSGRFPSGCDIAVAACRSMINNYHGVDGQPGWVFSIGPNGQPIDRRRDLYAHAFVLFALAWTKRCKPGNELDAAIADTLDFIDHHMGDRDHGGYWDCQPPIDDIRRQNPHMHLFEALLAINETQRDKTILDRCRTLRDLAVGRFVAEGTGALCEDFHQDWTVHPEPGKGRVEPGHLFEWAWLLRRFEHATGEQQSSVVNALIGLATECGLDAMTGRIIDEVDETGNARLTSSRSWPHAEALKSLSTECALGSSQFNDKITSIASRLLRVYCPTSLAGGWIDHVDHADMPLSTAMPASTLYHLYFGLTSLDDVVAHTGKADPQGI